ncbi:hypothetical protein HDF18_08375 [Mucilaginibacter sp. X5P1]|uniref:hypothetical protein n=1 Tax=Mucilaginibacter sp. X5P1 TaxID=2723088 RepID=UPI001616057E|nr:hypothetical protein [Mucilaginibacter sp. X5P1]MBB6137672.1 hypothetical protein [Mucilaginibacter sp. X5P1]
MNWIHFLLWLGGTYTLYYLALVLWDNFKMTTPQNAKSATNALTFSEQVTPHDAAALLENQKASAGGQPKNAPEMIASGGVVLKDVFSLARKEAIVYIKEVSF